MNETGQSTAAEQENEDPSARQPVQPSKSDNGEKTRKEEKPNGPPVYRRPAYIITVSAVAAVAIIAAIFLWWIFRQYFSTDDAYIDGHVAQIAPRVSAQVLCSRAIRPGGFHRPRPLYKALGGGWKPAPAANGNR